MYSVTEAAGELKELVAWQRTPKPLDDADYVRMILRGLKRLYVDTARALEYADLEAIEDEKGQILFTADLLLDEQEYVLLCARIMFFEKVQSDVNNVVGYTTNAMTVTGADKPYAHLKDTIDRLDNERRILYYKMTRYALSYIADDEG